MAVTTHTITIYETESKEAALKELNRQLKKITLKKNTAGIITCNVDYADSGIVKAVAEACPFDTIGMISTLQSAGGEAFVYAFIITVLTSDDINFAVAATDELDPLADHTNGVVLPEEVKKIAAEKLQGEPKLAFLFAPLFLKSTMTGDCVLNSFEEWYPGVPMFGSLAIDDGTFQDKSTTFLNGTTSNKIVFILMSGNVNPKFYISILKSFNEHEFQCGWVVTKSEKNKVIELNNKPATNIFHRLGVSGSENETFENLWSMPFEFTVNDGMENAVHIRRTLLNSNENEGTFTVSANIPNDSTLRIAKFDGKSVIESSAEIASEIRDSEAKKIDFVFIVSCVSRKFILGAEDKAEAEMFAEALDGTPYLFTSSGGEFCNLFGTNTFQNFSAVVCTI
jgi:hypothetical protein